MDFTPAFPNFRQRIFDSFQRQPFMAYIGAQLILVEAGIVELRLPYKEELSQQHGYFHGGIIGTLADNSAGYAAYTLMEQHSSVLSVEFKLNLLAPGKGQALTAKSKVLKRGRTLTVCRSEVYVTNSNNTQICAAAQATLIELKNAPDK